MVRAQLRYDVDREDTEFYIMTVGALEQFPSSGEAYVGDEKFTYTSRDDKKLIGCSGIEYSHSAGEYVVLERGVTLRSVAPPALKADVNDPDGVIDAILSILDETKTKYFKDKLLPIHNLINPVLAPEYYLEYICSNLGVEFGTDQPESVKRNLARSAADLLKARGSLGAFKFIVKHVLGYDVSVDISTNNPLAVMNDSGTLTYTPPYMMGIDNRVSNYWKFESLIGATTETANEISGGVGMFLHDTSMLGSTSMFPKDTSITFDNTYHYMYASGGSNTSLYFTSKDKFSFEWFMKPTTSAVFPQTIISKGSWLSITRTSEEDLGITINCGGNTATASVSNCITPNVSQMVTVIFDLPTLIVLVDGHIVYNYSFFPYPIIDDGSLLYVGNTTSASAYKGRFDTLRISVGKKYPTEARQYFSHIDILRSYYTNSSRGRYMLADYSSPYYVIVTINNDDGDSDKYYTLQYLIEEWLTNSNYQIIRSGNLPLELSFGLF